MSEPWCPVCSTQHRRRSECPGELLATGEERHGWRVNVETPSGIEAYGVLVAEADGLWRARILTYPNVLWTVPGAGGAIKFTGTTAREAERKAIDFIRAHCHSRRFLMRDEIAVATPGSFDREIRSGVVRPAPPPRKIRFLPVRFGVVRPSELGGTGNLSEAGMFIVTEAPVEAGAPLSLALDVRKETLGMRGRVVWMRKEHHVGRAPGMGVMLIEPPSRYVTYVRGLP
jgi:hypothetical protein